MKYLITGAAGFIGNDVAKRLCELGCSVVGIDNLNDYYDPALKSARLKRLTEFDNFRFIKLDLADREGVQSLFKQNKFDRVIHLGAQAGVRFSLEQPMTYVDSNLVGMATILEGCRSADIEHLVFASSSSVYGMNDHIPFSTADAVDHPVSLYAATKKANELMAHSYSHLYDLPTTGLRFFTVYGPWGRPDMAPFKFTQAIANGDVIDVYNHGQMQRDFTYIDDIVESVIRIQDVIPGQDDFQDIAENEQISRQGSPLYKIYNIGNSQPVELEVFISCIEKALNIKARKNYLPMQDGDVVRTYADTRPLQAAIGFKPSTDLQFGIDQFVNWFIGFYGIKNTAQLESVANA